MSSQKNLRFPDFYIANLQNKAKLVVMKKLLWKFRVCLLPLFIFSNLAIALEVDDVNLPPAKAAVIVCKGLIDDGLYKSIRRRTELALDGGAEYLIYEIGTYGGLLKSADDISKYFILEVSKKAKTVAYITTEAISAGAMISVSCGDIIMLENTTIGDCAPITIGGKLEGVEREKAESFTRVGFDRAAEANGYPPALLRAMVSMQIEVYRVRNLQTDEYDFFESERLPKDPNNYDLDNKELVVRDDQILTLTSSKAFEYGIARAEVNGLGAALDFLAERDGVVFGEQPITFETNWSEEMVRWVNSPAVMSVLVLLALLGAYVELNSPGVGLPGLVAVICVIVIIGSKYLVGLANWLEVALFVVGVLLLMIEIFVLPGFGVAGLLGILCIFGGLFGMLIKNPPDKLPWPETSLDWQFFTDGVMGLFFGVVGFTVLAWLFTKYLPKLQFLSGLILTPATAKRGDEFEVSMTAPASSDNRGLNIGDRGEVISALRPTGEVKFGDAVVDVVARGDFLDKGRQVEIIEVHGNRVVVRAV